MFRNALRNASIWRVIRRRLEDNTAADLAELELTGLFWFKIGSSSRPFFNTVAKLQYQSKFLTK